MTNNYQNERARTSVELRHAMPETVRVSMAGIAELDEHITAQTVGAIGHDDNVIAA